MRRSSTRRVRGGFNATNRTRIATHFSKQSSSVQKQIQHCVSQLRRFCNCFLKGDTGRLLQFGYNLGRLQELCGETEKHVIWWKPVDAAIAGGKWQELSDYIDTMRTAIGVEYDSATVAGAC